MSTFLRPGSFIVESLNPLPSAVAPTANAIVAFVSACNQGPTVPTRVDSWQTFTTLYGSFGTDFLAYALYTYFQNGGAACYVQRAVHTDAVVATRTLNDTGGTPLPTLRVDAANPGAWGNNLAISITAGFTTGRFNLLVSYNGVQVEQYSDLSISSGDARYAPATVNSVSRYVKLTNLNSATSAPNNAPATQANTSLATGANGGTATATDYTTALGLLSTITQPVVLSLPGVSDTTILAAAQTFVASQAAFFQIVDPAVGLSVSAVEAFAAGLTPTAYAAVYYPWLVIPDPTKPTTSGATVTVPPSGAVAAKYMTSDAAAGPFQTPAGTRTALTGVTSLGINLAASDYDSLNSANPPVNALKPIPGYGICIFGGRTLQGGFPSLYIAIRRSLIYIEQSLLSLTTDAIFEPNDATLWASISSVISTFLNDYYSKGGLAGATAAQAFFVTCDATNNTTASIQAGTVNVTVGVALEYPAEFIVINVGQFSSGASTVSSSLTE